MDTVLHINMLIVEDDASCERLVRRFLSDLGYNDVDVASDGHKALTMIDHKSYDLIWMDLMLPNISGPEVTESIRAQHPSGGPYIIGLTAHAFASDKAKGLQAGMNDYVTKPFSRADLADALARYTAVD